MQEGLLAPSPTSTAPATAAASPAGIAHCTAESRAAAGARSCASPKQPVFLTPRCSGNPPPVISAPGCHKSSFVSRAEIFSA